MVFNESLKRLMIHPYLASVAYGEKAMFTRVTGIKDYVEILLKYSK